MSALTLSANVNNNIPGIGFNDLYMDKQNNIATSTDLQAVLEECAQAARTLLGECIFNLQIGIPYEQVVWVGVPNLEQFSASLRQAFLSIDGVNEVVSLFVQQQSNTFVRSQSSDMLLFNAIIQTIYGTGTIQ